MTKLITIHWLTLAVLLPPFLCACSAAKDDSQSGSAAKGDTNTPTQCVKMKPKDPSQITPWQKPIALPNPDTFWKPQLDRPNIILISLDTTRADYLGCYGHPWVKTPNLDALAAESVQFLDAQCPASSTLASHTALFTGSYPHTAGVPRNRFKVMDENIMLPELLRDAGYSTSGIIGGLPLTPFFNFNQGFDYYDSEAKQLSGSYEGALKEADEIVDRAITHISERNPEKPLFLFLHFFDAHSPYLPKSEFLKPYRDLYIPDGTPTEKADGQTPPPKVLTRHSEYTMQRYAAEITYMDHHLGRLFTWLKERELFNDTLIIITNDHGESCWDSEPYFQHSQYTDQATTKAIGVWHLPGNAFAGGKCSNFVSTVDFMPTLCAWLNLPMPERIEGQAIDFALVIENKLPEHTRFCEATIENESLPASPTGWLNFYKHKSARRGNYKLIHDPISDQYSLFDIPHDLLERKNLLPTQDPALLKTYEELRAELESWAYVHGIKSEYIVQDGSDIDIQLKSLGYF